MDQGFVGPFFCPVCHGGDCLGGTRYDRCARRDKRPSRMAGILDTYGGIRFVVDYHEAIRSHARHDETVVMVPRLKVHEPIAYAELPRIEADVLGAVNDWLARGPPNEPSAREAATMYRLRQLENPSWKRSLDLYSVVWC